jgi:Brp/Blh family beta-carotene 15,15'-monooxygenase
MSDSHIQQCIEWLNWYNQQYGAPQNDPATVVRVIRATADFGTGDSLATPSTPLLVRIAEVLARGGLVLTLPTLFNRQEILQLFSYLIPESSARSVVSMLAGITPIIAVCLLVCIIWSGLQFIRSKEPLFLLQAVELAVLAAFFCILPALLAFGVYFSFLHSIRHMLRLSGNPETGSALLAVAGLIRLALPVQQPWPWADPPICCSAVSASKCPT